jgi:hypothetical protein
MGEVSDQAPGEPHQPPRRIIAALLAILAQYLPPILDLLDILITK